MYHSSFVLILLSASTILSFVMAFLAARAKLLSRGSRQQFVFVSLASAAMLFTILSYLTIRSLRPNLTAHNIAPSSTFQVSVTFIAPSEKVELIHVPFSVGSGSINVGCDESQNALIRFHLPLNAKVDAAQADWVNTDNLAAESQNVSVQGDQVIATGQIRGQAKNWILNCPGGGHGELFLRGAYSTENHKAGPSVVLGTIRDVAHAGSKFTVKVPPDVSRTPLDCEIKVVGSDGTTTLEGVLSQGPADKLLFEPKKQTGPLTIKPFFELNSMVIQF